jgi:hypothetical protein
MEKAGVPILTNGFFWKMWVAQITMPILTKTERSITSTGIVDMPSTRMKMGLNITLKQNPTSTYTVKDKGGNSCKLYSDGCLTANQPTATDTIRDYNNIMIKQSKIDKP